MARPPTRRPAILRGGEWLLRARPRPTRLHAGAAHRRAPADRPQTAASSSTTKCCRRSIGSRQKDWDARARSWCDACGELGLLGVDVAEEYGGLGLDKVTSLVVSEQMARSASFGATFGAQANLTILPLSLFGTEAQKQKYLPRLLSGELVGAYCLSETGSGSDALGAQDARRRGRPTAASC